MRHQQWALTLAFLGLSVSSAAGQEVTFGGQIRPRYEFRDPVGLSNAAFTTMRARAHVSALLERNVRVFVQFQDVRMWGEETNTLTDFRANNFDLHQGYIEVRGQGPLNLSAKVGRQATSFGGERLVGAVEWTQQGRVFDGVRLGAQGGWGTIDVIAYQLADADATAERILHDAELLGLYATIDAPGPGSLDIYGLFNHVAGDTGAADPGTDETTLGVRWWGRSGNITFRAEGSYQLGNRDGIDLAAFMVGARVGTSLAGGKAGITLWYDYLSGDDNPADNKVKVFSTLFATNHKFYGFADLFTDIPAHTGGQGLQDIAVKATLAPSSDLRLAVDLHHFRLAEQGRLTSARLGEEVDVTATYRYRPNLNVTAGLSHVLKGDALEALGRLRENMTFTYVMLTATF